MKVNIPTEQANGLERKLSVELHQRICRTQENTVYKTKGVAVRTVHPDNKTAEANICVINNNSLVLPCLTGSGSSTSSLKRQRQFIDQMKQTL